MNSLIIYSTTDGQTKKICETLKEHSIDKNFYEIISLEEAFNKEIKKYEKIIIGASIRYGRHNPKIYEFIKMNKAVLEKKKNAFFSKRVLFYARLFSGYTSDSHQLSQKHAKWHLPAFQAHQLDRYS